MGIHKKGERGRKEDITRRDAESMETSRVVASNKK
jgi:hypothetical protein